LKDIEKKALIELVESILHDWPKEDRKEFVEKFEIGWDYGKGYIDKLKADIFYIDRLKWKELS